jgi:hypothetical protein
VVIHINVVYLMRIALIIASKINSHTSVDRSLHSKHHVHILVGAVEGGVPSFFKYGEIESFGFVVSFQMHCKLPRAHRITTPSNENPPQLSP